MADELIDSTPIIGQESSLSNWVGPYATEMLGRGMATASQPYQVYSGPLTAGSSSLQDKAFQGIGSLDFTSGMGTYNPTSFTSPGVASTYMSPFIEGALEPQMAEARRQAEISRVNNAGRMTQAGSFGGGRQAIMESEIDRNLLRTLSDIYGTGMQKALEFGANQFNTEEDRKMGAVRDANDFGMSGIRALTDLGEIERGITSEGIAADYNQFKEERDFPYKNVQFLQSLLQGLPLATEGYSYAQPSSLQNFLGSAGGIMELLNGWGE